MRLQGTSSSGHEIDIHETFAAREAAERYIGVQLVQSLYPLTVTLKKLEVHEVD